MNFNYIVVTCDSYSQYMQLNPTHYVEFNTLCSTGFDDSNGNEYNEYCPSLYNMYPNDVIIFVINNDNHIIGGLNCQEFVPQDEFIKKKKCFINPKYLLCSNNKLPLLVTNVVVDKKYRRNKICTNMLNLMKKYYLDKKIYSTIYLEVYKNNNAAFSVYTQNGFSISYEYEQDRYNDNKDELYVLSLRVNKYYICNIL